ncbi:MAG: DUF4406 domain-containing protein [Myxococcota bacterium]|jgi:hypothetical protein|nr:DUF4406 domain-containing protein [Myxococcota bacterium]
MSGTRKLVFVSSPYRGNVARNVAVARAAARLAFEAGHVPVVPHLYVTQVLDDEVPEDRKAGIAAALELLARCDEVWAFGEPSEGMRQELDEATRLQIPIMNFTPPPPADPCWRCEGTRVVSTGGELPSFVPCPECARPMPRAVG